MQETQQSSSRKLSVKVKQDELPLDFTGPNSIYASTSTGPPADVLLPDGCSLLVAASCKGRAIDMCC
jgi:hypothetical protein